MPLLPLLFVILFILQIMDFIAISWWLVFAPLLVLPVVMLVILLLPLIILFTVSIR